MKANFMITCVTEKELQRIRIIAHNTDNGSRTSKMALELRSGQISPSLESTTWTVRKKALENGHGQTDQFTKETGMTTKSLALEFTNGQMEESTRVNTSEVRWKASVITSIPMAQSM